VTRTDLVHVVVVLLLAAGVVLTTGERGGTGTGDERPPTVVERERSHAHAPSIGHDRGTDAAPVRVVEFSDFGCPYCGEFAREVHPALHREYVETGRVRWTYVPVVMGVFRNGGAAALAAECAAEQGEGGSGRCTTSRRPVSGRCPDAGFPCVLMQEVSA
jgi:hypothetical protein